MTRRQLAREIVHRAVQGEGPQRDATVIAPVKDSQLLRDVLPSFDAHGRAMFSDRLIAAAHGLGEPGQFHFSSNSTVADAIGLVAASLPLRIFRCTDTVETHLYEAFGNGKCEVDDTPLVELP